MERIPTRRPVSIRPLSGLALAAAGLAVLAPAAHASGWGAPIDLSEPVGELSAGPPQLAALGDGRVLAAWRQPRSATLQAYAVEAAIRPAAGRSWQRMGPLGLGVQQPYMSLGAAGLRAVLATRGDFVSAPSGGPFAVTETRALARVLGDDGRWDRATVLSSPRRVATAPRAAVDGGGTALVVWHEQAPGLGAQASGDVRVASRAPGGPWTGPRQLSAAGSYEPAIAAGAGGSLAVWLTDESGGAAVWGSERPVGGDWGPPRRLSGAPAAVTTPGVAMNPAGDAVVVWQLDGAMVAATRDRAGRWASPAKISGAARVAHKALRPPPAVAIDDAGAIVVAWRADSGVPAVLDLRVATRPAGGSWRAVEVLSAPAGRSVGAPAVAIRGGRAIVAWPQPRGLRTVLTTRRNDLARGAWAAPERVSPPGEAGTAPALLIDGRGRAICVYVAIQNRGTIRRAIVVRVAERPATPPARRPVRLTREQLLVNQRISQTALRRVNAVLERLDGGLTAADIRRGSLLAASFGPGVTVGGLEAAEVVDPGPPAPIRILAPPRSTARPELSAEQLLVNHRIAMAALRRAKAARRLLTSGLTGANVRDGSLGAEHLAPGLAVVAADDAPAAAPRPATARAGGGNVRVRLSPEQLLITQRIAQAAVSEANALVARVEGGFGAEDFRPGSLGGADLRPDAR
jgi:hypothetical protein